MSADEIRSEMASLRAAMANIQRANKHYKAALMAARGSLSALEYALHSTDLGDTENPAHVGSVVVSEEHGEVFITPITDRERIKLLITNGPGQATIVLPKQQVMELGCMLVDMASDMGARVPAKFAESFQ